MIRNPKTEDIPTILNIYKQRNYQEEVLHYTDFSHYMNNMRVYEIDNKVVGFILYYDMGGRWCFIDLLSIDKEYRGQGIGKMLIESLKDHKNWSYLFTSVIVEDEKAINFAEKCGFEYNNQLTQWMWKENK